MKTKFDFYVDNGHTIKINFAQYLQEAEKKLGINHTIMAQQLKVPYRTYQNWVAGKATPAYPTREYTRHKIELLLAIYNNGGMNK